MKLICPKCKGMKKFYVGIPVARRCEKHGSVNLIHVNAEIEMPADPEPEELTVKGEEIPLESALAVLPDLGVDVLRNMARDLKVGNWWNLTKENLVTELGEALKAEYAAV